MRYVISDIHAEYELFIRLMDKISFSDSDELYVCGDIIEKGPHSVKLARYIFSKPNIHAIMGNHEDGFIKYYHFLMEDDDISHDEVLAKLGEYLQGDGSELDFDTVDRIEALPLYIEADSFICVHAGLTLDEGGRVPRLSEIGAEQMLYNRRFKNTDVIPRDSKCVFFGHTTTEAICGKPRILVYKKSGAHYGDIRDLSKVHLDTGTNVSGVLGCFCIDTCKAHYVKRYP